jgi:DNA-binding CsgD family transcriptional regulator
LNHTALKRPHAKGRQQSRAEREPVSLDELKAEADRCHTPGQFGELLQHLRKVVPYEKFAGIWGHPSETIRFMFYKDIPIDLIRWRLKAGLQYMLCGGSASKERFVMFAAAMPSEESGRAYLKPFDSIAPFLVEASQRAYPRSLLTSRETAILERRANGEVTKQIAAAERISERTVGEHLHHIKKKLFTDDIVNAVVIAVKGGMVLPPWKKGMKDHFF